MLPRFHWSDITTVGHYLGVLILLTGMAMCVPAVVALVFGEFRELGAFLVGIGVCMTLGATLRFLKSYRLDRRRSLLLVGFGWIVIGFVAAVPLYISGEFDSWFDALFDSVSALTTTGVTIAGDVDSMSYAQITWRVVMSFTGAVAVIIIALYSGFFGEGSKGFMINSRRGGERTRPRISETSVLVLRVLAIFVVVGVVASTGVCLFLGFDFADAFMNGAWLSLCAVGTGGFVPHTSDLVYYHSLLLEFVLSVLMIAGAVSFGVYAYVRAQRYSLIRRDSELRVYALWIVFLVAFVTWVMTREGVFTTIGGLMQNGFITVISAATTCGMQSVYPEQMGAAISEGAVILLIVAILFGACAYSSGGGIKIVRILQVLRWIKYSILLRLAPDSAHVRVKYEHFGAQKLNSKDAVVAMTVFILYLATAALGSMAFIAYGNDALNSVFEAISYVSNCGMTTEITQAGLPFGLKVVALLLMWAGRIEFIALIAAVVGIVLSLHPGNLFSNDRSRDLRERKKDNWGGTAWRRRKGQKGKSPAAMVVAGVLAVSLVCTGSPAALAATGGAQVPAEDVETLGSGVSYTQVDIRALLSASTRQDGRRVEISGEAIGGPLTADDGHVWVNVKQEGAMVGICMSEGQAKQIEHYGAYQMTGDTLVVKGTFNLACPQHAGELDVHAISVEVVEPGFATLAAIDLGMYAVGVLLIAIGMALMVIYRIMHGGTRLGLIFKRWRKANDGA